MILRPIILLLCTISTCVLGQAVIVSGTLASASLGVSGTNAPAISYVLNQNFEGTGYDNSETWYTDGDVNADFSTSGLSMEGSQCLELYANTVASDSIISAFNPSTPLSTAYAYFLFRVTVLPTTITRVALFQSDFDVIGNLSLLSDGTLYLREGTGTWAQTIGAVSVNTTYHVFLKFVADSGAGNGIMEVGFSTDGSRPTTGNNHAICTDGNNATAVNRFGFKVDKDGTGQKQYYDKARVSASAITSAP